MYFFSVKLDFMLIRGTHYKSAIILVLLSTTFLYHSLKKSINPGLQPANKI